jgi:hypothetical protein
VTKWYANNGRRDKSQGKSSVVKKWMLQGIIQFFHNKEISKAAEKASGANPGSATYLKHYKPAMKTVSDKLPSEKIEEYIALVEKWNNDGTAVDVRRK